jgi:hypothetical protein
MEDGIEVLFSEGLQYLNKEGYVTLKNYFLDFSKIRAVYVYFFRQPPNPTS